MSFPHADMVALPVRRRVPSLSIGVRAALSGANSASGAGGSLHARTRLAREGQEPCGLIVSVRFRAVAYPKNQICTFRRVEHNGRLACHQHRAPALSKIQAVAQPTASFAGGLWHWPVVDRISQVIIHARGVVVVGRNIVRGRQIIRPWHDV